MAVCVADEGQNSLGAAAPRLLHASHGEGAMQDGELSGPLPASLGRLQELRFVIVFGTGIDNIDALASCARLRHVGADSCALTQFPRLATCTALERLEVGSNDICGEAPARGSRSFRSKS